MFGAMDLSLCVWLDRYPKFQFSVYLKNENFVLFLLWSDCFRAFCIKGDITAIGCYCLCVS